LRLIWLVTNERMAASLLLADFDSTPFSRRNSILFLTAAIFSFVSFTYSSFQLFFFVIPFLFFLLPPFPSVAISLSLFPVLSLSFSRCVQVLISWKRRSLCATPTSPSVFGIWVVNKNICTCCR